jgi:AbrB family looped-hinge helix DNA binding protein
MPETEKAELTILSEKGQVVIPANIRSKMRLKPKTKFLVYEFNDSVILKKFKEPDISEELKAVFKRVDEKIAKYGEVSNDEINEIIHNHRQSRKHTSGT